MFRKLTATAVLSLSLFSWIQSVAVAQDEKEKKDPLIGRKVMTVVWGAEFKLGKDVVGIVELGKVFTVDGHRVFHNAPSCIDLEAMMAQSHEPEFE